MSVKGPVRVASSTSARSNKSTVSHGSSLPPLSPRRLFELDHRKYDHVTNALLFPIAEMRHRTSKSPPQQLIQDVKSLLIKSRHGKRRRVRIAETVESLMKTLHSSIKTSRTSFKDPVRRLGTNVLTGTHPPLNKK
jgi:hypothetical protein